MVTLTVGSLRTVRPGEIVWIMSRVDSSVLNVFEENCFVLLERTTFMKSKNGKFSYKWKVFSTKGIGWVHERSVYERTRAK
jgi:hypothetical protein